GGSEGASFIAATPSRRRGGRNLLLGCLDSSSPCLRCHAAASAIPHCSTRQCFARARISCKPDALRRRDKAPRHFWGFEPNPCPSTNRASPKKRRFYSIRRADQARSKSSPPRH